MRYIKCKYVLNTILLDCHGPLVLLVFSPSGTPTKKQFLKIYFLTHMKRLKGFHDRWKRRAQLFSLLHLKSGTHSLLSGQEEIYQLLDRASFISCTLAYTWVHLPHSCGMCHKIRTLKLSDSISVELISKQMEHINTKHCGAQTDKL